MFPLEGLYGSPSLDLNPSDLPFNQDFAPSEDDTDPSIFNTNDLLTAEDDSMGLSALPFLQSSSACGTKKSVILTNEDALQLQTRDGASCAPLKSDDQIDSIVDFFQDPEGWLRRKFPPAQAPVGQVNRSGLDGDDMSFEAF